MQGVGGRLLCQFNRIPKEISAALRDGPLPRKLTLIIDLPEGWTHDFDAELKRFKRSLTPR